ncbi:MAG TPA: ribosome-associated translation inhibitor RaiA [Blastocatellia bacterium]|nr:ribosome-associated translation inhibitor RaiA [Blastocatellia bacterium]
MQYDFTGRHIEVTPAIVTHTKEHLDKLDRFLNGAPTKAHVILTVEKRRHIAEIVITWRDHQFAGTFACMDMYQSVARASEKIEKQVMKLKEKFRTRSKGSASANSTDNSGSVVPAAAPARIIRSRKYHVKPMTPEEAAHMVNDSPDQFVVFRDAETDRVGVIYKRKDGNFGLIEP